MVKRYTKLDSVGPRWIEGDQIRMNRLITTKAGVMNRNK